MPIEIGKISLQRFLERQRAGKVVGREHITLDLTKDDLDLIQPTGVLGQPVQPYFAGQLQRGQPSPELFGGMGGTVVENQMNHFAADTERTLKECEQEGFEIDKLLTRPRLGEGQPAGHDQSTEE